MIIFEWAGSMNLSRNIFAINFYAVFQIRESRSKEITSSFYNSNPMDDISKSSDSDFKLIYRNNNHIYFYDKIDSKNVLELASLLSEAEEYCLVTSLRLRIDGEIPIYLHINSNGGSLHPALNAIDIINACKVPVHSIVEGLSASASTLLSIVCKKRYIRPNAYMLIHQLNSECVGKMSEIADEFDNLSRLMDRIRGLYLTHSKFNAKNLKKLLHRDLLLDADLCIQHGLVDELWMK